MARRKRTPKPILRRITITLGGRHVKTVRDRISLRQADRELPVTPSPLHGPGAAYTFKRRIKTVSIEFEYSVVGNVIDDLVHVEQHELNPADTIYNVRHGGERGTVL